MPRRIGILCLLGLAACNGGGAQRQDGGPAGAGGTTGAAGGGAGGTTGAAGRGAGGTTGAAGGGAGGTTGAAGGGAGGTTGAAGGGAGGTTGAAGGGAGGTTGAAGGGAGGTTGTAGGGGGGTTGAAGGGAGGTTGTAGGGGAMTLKDRFPVTRPASITASATITKNDVVCVMVGTSTGCLAQNAPPCNPAGGQTTVSLQLTIDAQDNITVEAPYQDMCAPDYFCAISGPGCPIPTSYPVPLVNHAYLYDPRSTDRCRRDMSGNLTQVEHDVDVSANGAASLTIHQVCHTRMRNDGTTPSSYVNDTRDWTTVISF